MRILSQFHLFLRPIQFLSMRFWCLLFLLPVFAMAQPKQLQELAIADGLSQGMVFAMMQDKEGYVWVATKNGLNRYDGYSFKTYFPNPLQAFSITDNQVTALYEDRYGRIWIGTATKGICLFDRRTQKFYHASLQTRKDPATGQFTGNEHVCSITEDPDGNIWVGNLQNEIMQLQLPPQLLGKFPLQEDFTSDIKPFLFPSKPKPQTAQRLISFMVHGKNMWVMAGNDLLKIDYRNRCFYPARPANKSHTQAPATYFEANANTVLADAGDVIELKDTLLVKKWLRLPPGFVKKLSQVTIDGQGTAWAIRNGQLYRQHYSKLDSSFGKQPAVAQLHNGEYITCKMVDNQGNIWLGTNGYGVKKWLASQGRFRQVLTGQSIYHVYEDDRDRVFCWDYLRCYLLDTMTGKESRNPVLTQYNAAHGKMVQDKNGSFWWIMEQAPKTGESMLAHLTPGLQTIKDYPIRDKINFQYCALVQGQDGMVWIAGANSELIRFNPANGQFDYYDYSHLIPRAAMVHGVVSMYEDTYGQLWLCTQEGLLKASIAGEKVGFQHFKSIATNPQTLRSNYITGVVDDPGYPCKYLWIATNGGGLSRLDKTSSAMRNFTDKQGLLSNNVVGILADSMKNIWISTYRGLTQINTASLVFSHYSEQDGLQSDEFNTGVFFKNRKGGLLFGGINGLNIFTPTPGWEKKAPAMVRIASFKINNGLIQPGDSLGILKEAIEYLPALSLAHYQNQLSFEFTTLDLQNGRKSLYRYKMVGIDNNWVEGGNNRFANYAQLPPGHYTLQVIASLDGAMWTPQPTELQITIRPPWYQSCWAYLVYMLLLGSLAWWTYGVRVRRARLQAELALGQREAGRLAELDQLKTRFFTNISHEFRTPLTLLIGPVEDLKRQFPNMPVLGMMERNAQRLLALINQLLDLGKLDAGEMKVNLRQGDAAKFIHVLASTFAPLAESRQIIFETSISHPGVIAWFDADKLEKIVTNLLSNAFKFTPAGKKVQLAVIFDEPPSHIRVLLKDEGSGMSAPELAKIFDRFYQTDTSLKRAHEGTGIGLSLVKEMVTLLDGQIMVESELGQGTCFTITLPLARQHSHKAPGDMEDGQAAALAYAEGVGLLPRPSESNSDSADNILLIVEDNHDLRAYIRSVFESDYQVLEANDGKEGYEKATQSIPDIIISDVMMPHMDGFEFCQLIKTTEKTSHIPVVMLTAKAGMDSRIGGLELGADDYLTKPFNATEIRARVKNLISMRQKLRERYGQKVADLKPGKVQVTSMDRLFIDKVKAIVEAHLAERDFGVEAFAAEMNLSPVQLRRKLKATTNLTTNEFVRHYRLQRAAQLLAAKAAPVSDIAYQVGFDNPSYFAKAFQDEFGTAPSEWGKQVSNSNSS